MARKLSLLQQHVIDRLQEGWELGQSMTTGGHCWMQRGGLGKGGTAENVLNSTLYALVRRNLIEVVERQFPTRRYALTSKGKIS